MNWTEQVESMMKMWNESQKQFLGGWGGLAGGMPGMSGMSGMPDLSNPMSWFMPQWAKNSSTGQATAGNIFSSQAMMMQSLGMLAQAWQSIAPSLAAGKPWQPDFDSFFKQWQSEVLQAPKRVSSAGMNVGELAKSLLGEWGPLLKPWLASIQGTGLSGPLGDMLGGDNSPLGKIFGSSMEPAFKDLAQIPMIGVGREQMATIMRAFDVHVDVRKATQKYQAAMTRAIGEAMKETMEQLVELAKKGEQIQNVRDLIRIWVRTTDKKFTKMYVSEDFIEIQREVSRANLQNKLAQRAVLEMLYKQLDIPTRTELDDAYKTIYNLRKEVRELRGARKQAASESAALADARKRANAEVTELRSVSRKLETELALLQDAVEKMSARLPADEPEKTAGKASAAGGKEPVKVTRKKVSSQKPAA
uniref:Poly(3-hydroxyalkanoate) polymerase subunit PhaE n=1 Tax=Candidatus Kentrum sp. DK TaxID=2126562 RepID=A0A450SZM4_9GAMM|nr:MAG: poly(R)-hydroxyalkanoic acid synthase, class III, PhaE subunit [Candidatus Kentron sp. DK]